jgi:hypothetical protein
MSDGPGWILIAFDSGPVISSDKDLLKVDADVVHLPFCAQTPEKMFNFNVIFVCLRYSTKFANTYYLLIKH